MAVRLGIAVERAGIRAVAMRRRQLVWRCEEPLRHESDLETTVRQILLSAPPHHRSAVALALGPAWARTKHITRLPTTPDRKLLGAIIREEWKRFFLARDVRLVMTDVRVTAPGEAWVAGLDASVVDAVRSACSSTGHTLAVVVPSVIVLGLMLDLKCLTINEGAASFELEYEHGILIAMRRLANGATHDSCVGVTAGQDGNSEPYAFAAAIGAALHARHAAVAYRPEQRVQGNSGVPAWRAIAAALAMSASGAGAIIAPGLQARHARIAAEQRLRAVADSSRHAHSVDEQLRRVTGDLVQIERFAARRRSPLVLLAHIGAALPERSALLALHIDSLGGTAVVLAQRVADVVGNLERVRELANPELLGPVTREVSNGSEYERATIRFRMAAPLVKHRSLDTLHRSQQPGT